MSTIAYRDFDLRRVPARAPRQAPVRRRAGAPSHGPGGGIIQRIFAAIERSLVRRAEEDAGQFIASHGGRLTDDIERQLAARFTGRGFAPSPQRPFHSTAGLLG
jgi:hypothetical protein